MLIHEGVYNILDRAVVKRLWLRLWCGKIAPTFNEKNPLFEKDNWKNGNGERTVESQVAYSPKYSRT